MGAVTGAFRSDLLTIVREPMLALLAVIPLALAVGLRWFKPAGLALLPPSVSPGVVENAVTAVLLLLTPMMFGFVFGLILLDERDEGALIAIALTPVGKTGFLAWRMAVPILWTMAATVVVLLLAGNVMLPLPHLLVLALLAGLQAPVLALFIAAFAPDKVAGMALAKVGSVLIALGALAVLAPDPWRWVAAPSPHFWLTQLAVGHGASPSFSVLSTVALLIHLGVVAGLARVFEARTG